MRDDTMDGKWEGRGDVGGKALHGRGKRGIWERRRRRNRGRGRLIGQEGVGAGGFFWTRAWTGHAWWSMDGVEGGRRYEKITCNMIIMEFILFFMCSIIPSHHIPRKRPKKINQ